MYQSNVPDFVSDSRQYIRQLLRALSLQGNLLPKGTDTDCDTLRDELETFVKYINDFLK
jgi:hypothetical protein